MCSGVVNVILIYNFEFAYMIVHGFYHLMGYDHIKEEDKVKMRPKEENVLNKLGIRREEMNEG